MNIFRWQPNFLYELLLNESSISMPEYNYIPTEFT